MQFVGQGYRSAEDNEGVAALSEGAALPKTLDLVVDVSNWSVLEYCTRHKQLLNACRDVGMFSNGRWNTMVDRRGMRHHTNIGAWEQCWSLMRHRCADTFSPAEPFDIPLTCHVDKVAYVFHLYALL